jgi:hypothetical protein
MPDKPELDPSSIPSAIPAGWIAMRLSDDIRALVREAQGCRLAYEQLTAAIDALGYRDAVMAQMAPKPEDTGP